MGRSKGVEGREDKGWPRRLTSWRWGRALGDGTSSSERMSNGWMMEDGMILWLKSTNLLLRGRRRCCMRREVQAVEMEVGKWLYWVESTVSKFSHEIARG